MRAARADDWRRRIYSIPYRLRISALQFNRVLGIGSGEVNFRGGITAVCGGNGVGKTTLLQTLLCSLSIAGADDTFLTKLSDSELMATIAIDGNEEQIRHRFSSGEEPVTDGRDGIDVTRIDPAYQSATLSSVFKELKNFDELLESLSPAEADNDERELLSYLVGKDYESCLTYEIEEYNNEPTFPYFVVRSGGITYSSESMGLGELSLHLMHWHLKRVTDGSVLLIEEPETHISPRSQSALVDVIAQASVKKSLWVVLTTHSPGIVLHLPLEHIRLMYRERRAVTISDRPTRLQLNSVLGMPHQLLGVFLVEDVAARGLLMALIKHYDPEILMWYEIALTGSEADTISALSFPRLGSWFRVVGVFDGDARIRISSLPEKTTKAIKWPFFFLPGAVRPEKLLRDSAVGNADLIANKLSREQDQIAFILSELEGFNDHDWLIELSNRCGVHLEQMIDVLFSVWINDVVNAAIARRIYEEIDGVLKESEE